MYSTITAVGVDLRRAKNALAVRNISLHAQLAVLPFELGDPARVLARRPRPGALIDLGLPDPGPQRLGMTPNWSAIRLIAPHAVAGSRRASSAILVARSRSSCGTSAVMPCSHPLR